MPSVHSKSAQRRLGVKITGVVVVAVAVVAVFFQWNWLRGPLSWELEQKLHRPVSISGDLEVHPWSGSPWARVNSLKIGDLRTQPSRYFVDFPRLTLGWRWLSIFSPRLDFPLIWAERPSLSLPDVTGGDARSNFSASGMPRIDHLVITGGAITLGDSHYRLKLRASLLANERRVQAASANDTVIHGAIVVGSPAWAGPRPLVYAPSVWVRLKLLPLAAGKLDVSLIKIDRPQINGVRDASGRANWQFSQAGAASHVPPIGRLVISDGAVHYQDAGLHLAFVGTVATNESVAEVGRGTFILQGHGTLRQTSFSTRVSGGPLINIDPHQAYPFDALVEAQGTRVIAIGSMAHPFDLRNVSGRLRASGPDLADLYRLTGVALPNSPPYALSTFFARVGSHYALEQMVGRLGESDLEGNVSVDTTRGRPFLDAVLSSRRLNITDLTAVAGGVPKHGAQRDLSPTQRATVARLTAEHRIFPDTHLDLSRIRSTDANVTYRARSVDAGRLPVRALFLKLTLDRGQLSIDPLTMTLPQGNIAASLHLDARAATPAEAMDVRLTNARLETLMGVGGESPPLVGGVYARAKLSGRGDSVRTFAASADGDVRAVIPQGEIRKSLAELMGIDAANGLFLLITKNQSQTPIRCGVADFQARSGVLTAKDFVFDTGVVLATGKGDVDLRDETLNLQLNGRPKKFRLLRIGAPITVRGSLASPKFGVDAGKAAGQLAVSGLLGAVVAPLSALLPFVNPGLAKNADCAALVRDADLKDAPPT